MDFSSNNILVTASTGSKKSGVNAILSLLQDLIVFQDKVGSAVDAQEMSENKKKLEDFQNRLGEMYDSLLDMAKGGVKSIRQESPKANVNPVMLNDNTIHKLPL
jgi:hypothetical protein